MSWRKLPADPEKSKAMLHELMPIGNGETPLSVTLSVDAGGNIRRADADYPNGWRLTVYFAKPKGEAVEISSVSAKLRVSTQSKGKVA